MKRLQHLLGVCHLSYVRLNTKQSDM